MSTSDESFMRGAFALARRTLGRTWPNPAVGAIVVRPGKLPEIVARGWTMPGGRPHAERAALEKAGEKARGCTLYVTLEPCAHHGQTPPCTDAIIEAGIKRVVCSARDPDPRVSGAGLARLRKAGIEVVEDVLAQGGARLSLGHTLRVTQNRPMIQLKLAVGSDGLVPAGLGAPVWATGDEARAHGHLLRARCDAILVGSGTVAADNPELTCRLPGMIEKSPVRIVLDSKLNMSGDAKLIATLKDAPLWVFGAEAARQDNANRLETAGAEVIKVPQAQNGGLDPQSIVSELATRGITRLLIEGGPRVAESFWSAGLVDEVCIYQGSKPAGEKGLKALSSQGLDAIGNAPQFPAGETRTFGRDKLTICRRNSA